MRKEKPKEKKNQKGRTNVVSKKQFITFYATSKTPQGITMVREGGKSGKRRRTKKSRFQF